DRHEGLVEIHPTSVAPLRREDAVDLGPETCVARPGRSEAAGPRQIDEVRDSLVVDDRHRVATSRRYLCARGSWGPPRAVDETPTTPGRHGCDTVDERDRVDIAGAAEVVVIGDLDRRRREPVARHGGPTRPVEDLVRGVVVAVLQRD